jgi:biotin carboxyl carrier protein
VRFDVGAGSRQLTIDVREQSPGTWAVTVDGQSMLVTLTRSGAHWSMLVAPSGGAGTEAPALTSHEIGIERLGRGDRRVHVDGRLVPIRVLDARTRSRAARAGATEGEAGPVSVASPMPGRVVKVLVAPGDRVAARQGLVVVEAMKMENELRAPRAGTVARVLARAGAPIEANTVLVVLDPAPERGD